MCGRFVLATGQAELEAEFAVGHVVGPDLPPSWNVAPTQQARIVAERYELGESGGEDPAGAASAPVRELFTARWGLVPHWAKDASIGTRMINARSETVTDKPAFRAAVERRRCLVPADGYYEWMAATASGAAADQARAVARRGSQPGKTPYFLHADDDSLLAMAGLYEVWRDPDAASVGRGADGTADDDALVWTFTVITRAAPDALGHIHDRSPVVVPADLRGEWLDCSDGRGDNGAASVRALLAEIPPPRLVPREVGRAVGNVRNNSPALIRPIGAGGIEPADAASGGRLF